MDESTLESLIGLNQEQLVGSIGIPDYAGWHNGYYVIVYEGAKRYQTEVLMISQYGGESVDVGPTKIVYCYVLGLDDSDIVQNYESIVGDPDGTSARDRPDRKLGLSDSCLEAVWTPGERDGVSAETAAFKRAQRLGNQLDLETRAKQGDRKAAFELASEFDDFTYVKVLAQEGDREAAFEMVSEFDDFTFVKVLAQKGDTVAAFALYELLAEERQTFAEAWGWLCMAANGSNGEAQGWVGHWHRSVIWQSGIERLDWLRNETGIQPDDRVAYMWYSLAELNGYIPARRKRDYVEADISSDEKSQAEQMVRDWKPGAGCVSSS